MSPAAVQAIPNSGGLALSGEEQHRASAAAGTDAERQFSVVALHRRAHDEQSQAAAGRFAAVKRHVSGVVVRQSGTVVVDNDRPMLFPAFETVAISEKASTVVASRSSKIC